MEWSREKKKRRKKPKHIISWFLCHGKDFKFRVMFTTGARGFVKAEVIGNG